MAKSTTKTKQKISSSLKQRKQRIEWLFPFEKQNLIIIAVGFAVILLGYALMATGISNEPAAIDGKWNNPWAVTVAPLLLVLGYCVIIPYAILKYFGKKNEPQQN